MWRTLLALILPRISTRTLTVVMIVCFLPAANALIPQTGYFGLTEKARALDVGNGLICVVTYRDLAECHDMFLRSPSFPEDGVAVVRAANSDACILYQNGNVRCRTSSSATYAYSGGQAVAIDVAQAQNIYAPDRGCLVLQNGNSQCWGPNYHGDGMPYLGGDAIDVSTASTHTCYLLRTGNVKCLGLNTSGAAAPYLGADAVAIAAADNHTCALRRGGTLSCWGQAAPFIALPPLAGRPIAITAGHLHTCALLSTGNVDCFFTDVNLAHSGVIDYPLGDAVAVSAGRAQTCVLRRDGNIVCLSFLYPMAPFVAVRPTVNSDGPAPYVCDDWNADDSCSPSETALQAENLAAELDVGCDAQAICVKIEAQLWAAGQDISESERLLVDTEGPSSGIESLIGHRPYTVQDDELVVHGPPTSILVVSQPIFVPSPGETVAVGASTTSFECGSAGPRGSVTTPSVTLGGIVVTSIPAQTRAEPSPVATTRCLAMDALDGEIVIPLADVTI